MAFTALEATERTNGSTSVSAVCRRAGIAGTAAFPIALKAAAARDRTTLAGGLAAGKTFLNEDGKPERNAP